MHYFPVFMNLQQQPVLMVGAGSVAERKTRLLLKAGANVRVVAREFNPQFQAWQQASKIECIGHHYATAMMDDVFLVFAATNDQELNRRVFEDAERRRIPANVVDDTPLCRFISPALVDRSPVQVAISTGGASPVMARRIRGWIERLLPLGLGRVTEAAGSLRSLVKETLPMKSRRPFWEHLLTDEQLSKWSLQDSESVAKQIKQKLQTWQQQDGNLQSTNGAEPSTTGEVNPGRVVLVGAGPGRADLLTLRAMQVLARADVILHDSLVSEEILDLARRDADRIFVGKRAGRHHHEQDEIHQLMLQEARKGRLVVRLKGGDAFIFGRGGEEIAYLREHGIDYEVVPGITAAIGCAAYAGIPLTHREHAQSVSFVTGHFSKSDHFEQMHDGTADHLLTKRGNNLSRGKIKRNSQRVDWTSVAGKGRTAVVYMGVKQASRLRREMLASGLSASLPVALIADGTRDTQKVLHGTISNLPALASQVPDGAPGLLVIGQVAALGVNLSWFGADSSLRTAA